MKKSILIAIFFVFAYADISAQCFLDRHNTTWLDGWISCETSPNPNAVRDESHWILYNLNYPYELFQMHIWNTNAPEYLTDGMNDIVIDISNDGVTWTEVGEFQIPIADGTPTYEGLDLFDFEGVNAQYVLITGLTNHGGDCFGLSEIRIDVADAPIVGIDEDPFDPGCLTARIFPNPISRDSKAVITSNCNNGPIFYSIRDVSGKAISSGEITPVSDEVVLELGSLPIVAGSYILSLQQHDLVRRFKIVKMD
jgi:hypothetical protein